MQTFSLRTDRREQFLRLDDILQEAIEAEKLENGLLLVHVPHTTAGVTLNENGDPDVPRDLLMRLRFLAEDKGYRHAEGNSDAHLKSSLLGCQVLVPVLNGRPQLGVWQSVWFCEFDGPRQRRLLCSRV